MQRLCAAVIVALIITGALTPRAAAATPQTFLYLNSQPGDYIGRGIQQTFTPAEGTFIVSPYSNGIQISFNTPNYSSFWSLVFSPPSASKFLPGIYEGAKSLPYTLPRNPASMYQATDVAAILTPVVFCYPN